jgi:hypothetical protein
VQTCRRELLDRALIWNRSHLLHALRQFEESYSGHRPHQGIANARPLQPLPVPLAAPDRNASLHIRRRDGSAECSMSIGMWHELHGWGFRQGQAKLDDRGLPTVQVDASSSTPLASSTPATASRSAAPAAPVGPSTAIQALLTTMPAWPGHLGRPLGQVLGGRRVAQVSGDEVGPAAVGADLSGDGLASLPVSPGGQDVPAAPAELGGDGLAYPPGRSGGQHAAASERCFWHLLLLVCMRRRSG